LLRRGAVGPQGCVGRFADATVPREDRTAERIAFPGFAARRSGSSTVTRTTCDAATPRWRSPRAYPWRRSRRSSVTRRRASRSTSTAASWSITQD